MYTGGSFPFPARTELESGLYNDFASSSYGVDTQHTHMSGLLKHKYVGPSPAVSSSLLNERVKVDSVSDETTELSLPTLRNVILILNCLYILEKNKMVACVYTAGATASQGLKAKSVPIGPKAVGRKEKAVRSRGDEQRAVCKQHFFFFLLLIPFGVACLPYKEFDTRK